LDLMAVVSRLDAIIGLLARNNQKEMGENMLTLSEAGLRSFEIAKILGRSNSYVRGELSRRRKSSER